MSRFLLNIEWMMMKEPKERQRGYGEAVPYLLIGSFVIGTSIFVRDSAPLSLLTVINGLLIFVYAAIYALPIHRRRAVLRLRIIGTLVSWLMILGGLLLLTLSFGEIWFPVIFGVLIVLLFSATLLHTLSPPKPQPHLGTLALR
jgi:hypothetical protein